MKARKAFASLILAFLILSLIQSFLPITPKIETVKAKSITWLSDYRYRKTVLINGVYGAGYGYQIMFHIRRNSGTDSGNTVYLNGKCLETFGDIRFADSEGNLLPYAIVSQSTDEAIVWVKLSTLNLDSDQIIYLYYGNLTTEAGISASDPDSTFIFYEDWSNETLNTDKWTGGTPNKIEPSLHRIYFKGAITRHLRTVNTLSFSSYFIVESWDALQGELKPFQIKFYAYSISQDKGIFSCHAGDFDASSKHWGTVFCGFYGSTSTPQGQAKEIAGVDSVILNQTDFTQGARTREWLIIRQGDVYTIYMDGQVFVNATCASTPNSISLYFYGDSNAYPYVYFYGFKIRKYIDPEPEPAIWYAEEPQPSDASAQWLSGYRYRKPFVVNCTPGAGVGYQIKLTIYRTTGVDNGHTVYLDEKCLPTFGDIRFTISDGVTKCPYYIFSVSTDSAVFWVKIMADLTYNPPDQIYQTIYIYYGNLTVQAGIPESSLDDTFIFAEPWDNSTLNTDRWTISNPDGTYSIDATNHIITLSGSVSYYLQSKNTLVFPETWILEDFYTDGGRVYFRGWNKLSSANYKYRTFAVHHGGWSSSDKGIAHVTAYSYYTSAPPAGYRVKMLAGVGGNDDKYEIADSSPSYGEAIWYVKITKKADGKIYLDIQTDHSGVWSYSEANSEVPDRVLIYFQANNGYVSFKVGAFKIRKYVEPEPTILTWGEEEETTYATLNVTVYPSTLESLYVPFKLDGTAYTAPRSFVLGMCQHTLEAVQQVVAINSTYQANFTAWYVNGTEYSTHLNITINLGGETTATMHYTITEVSGGESSEEQTTPSSEEEDEPSSFPPSYPFGSYAPVHFEAFNVELGIVKAGSIVNFEIGFSFDQVQIRVERVEFQQHSEWFTLDTLLPKTFSRGTDIIGTGKIQAVFHAPKDVDGTFMIPYTIYAVTSDGRQVSAQASISVTISKSQGVGIGDGTNITQPVLGNPLVLGLLALSICWFGYYAIKGKK